MLTNIDAVIFDLDGTLVDSMWIWKQIDEEYLKRYNISLPADFQKQIEGRSFQETAVYFKEYFNLADSLEQIMEDWNEMAMEMYCNHVPLKKNAREFLLFLRSNNIKIGIATSNSYELASKIVEVLEIEEFFDVIIASRASVKGKPEPDIYLLVAKELNVACDRCLVFEDIIPGIQAGLSAGMKVCAVEDVYSSTIRAQKKEIAHYFIDDFSEVILV